MCVKKIPRRSHRKPTRFHRGAAAVEFACVAPFLIMLGLAMTEFGRAMTVKHAVTMAAREGSREAVLPGATTSSVTSIVQQYVQKGGVSGEPAVLVSSDPSDSEAGTLLTVTVSIPFDGISNMATSWFTDDFRIRAASTMRKEGFD